MQYAKVIAIILGGIYLLLFTRSRLMIIFGKDIVDGNFTVSKTMEVTQNINFDQWLHIFGPIMLTLTRTQKDAGVIIERNMWHSFNDSFLRVPQLHAYYEQVLGNKNKIRRICELGFNGGHSALMWASLFNGDLELLSFDLCTDKRCDIGEAFIRKMFPNIRLKIIRGDSTKTVPNYVLSNTNVKCDFISIDSDHFGSVDSFDILNMRYLASRNHTVAFEVADEMSRGSFLRTVSLAWKRAISSKIILQQGECQFCYSNPVKNRTCKFCFGKYVFGN
ncbi:unnamed protein product [Mytilus edulis]|uniref:Methyltransferase domain-containing protein n=1 Tax=Mytilus edulis TaxID=6550 RepID=A0A8S3VSQ2_MYTED|nr:unnamed protein product [Mytilus edulis]